jgi:hypothetical protein
MELFKLRYNLYKYLIKNNFKFKNSLNSLNVFKNLIYITIIFFILIFLIGFEYINFFIIFFIIILIILIYNIEKILIKLDEILSNKFFQNYSNYYNTLNKIFNINYDNINDINGIINSPESSSSVTNIEMTYGGVGYIPNTEYTITITQPATEAKATANIKALRNGSLSGEIYNLNSGTGITDLDIIPTITLGTSTSPVSILAPATFKYYVSNRLTMANIKEYSLLYMNMYENIKKKIGFIDNVLNEDIDEHINLIKKENDLLKYIDVYDNKYEFLKKFIILNEDKNEKLFNIFRNNPITDFIENMNDKTILINLENLEKYKDNNNIKDKYSKFMNELELKDLNFLENHNLNNNEKILKTIENFDIIFYYLLIIIIIIFTILLHIFFIKLY